MVERPKGEKPRARMVRATDAEWTRVRDDAAGQDCGSPSHVMRTLLARPEPTEPGLPPSLVRRRLARAVLVLEWVEQLRFEEQGGEDIWRALVKRDQFSWRVDDPIVEQRRIMIHSLGYGPRSQSRSSCGTGWLASPRNHQQTNFQSAQVHRGRLP